MLCTAADIPLLPDILDADEFVVFSVGVPQRTVVDCCD
jgi:hypothetical protein